MSVGRSALPRGFNKPAVLHLDLGENITGYAFGGGVMRKVDPETWTVLPDEPIAATFVVVDDYEGDQSHGPGFMICPPQEETSALEPGATYACDVLIIYPDGKPEQSPTWFYDIYETASAAL